MTNPLSSQLVSRSWNGTPISRRTTDGYVNATAMCKANRKLWADFWRTDRCTEYLEALSKTMGNPIVGPDGLVQTRSGRNGGTWVHPDVATELARWISPAFSVFVNQWFREAVEAPATPQQQSARQADTHSIPRAQPTALFSAVQRENMAAMLMLADAVAKVPGVKPGIAMAATLAFVQENTGLATEPLRRVLPANEEPICSLNATKLGRMMALSAKETNLLLEARGMQVYNAREEWELTETGQCWAEAMPFSRNGHTGYQILWNPAVADILRGESSRAA